MQPLDRIGHGTFIYPGPIVDDDSPVGAFADANPNSVDSSDHRHALVLVHLGATDIAMSSLAVYAGPAAASGASDATYAKITGAELTGAALPQADDDNKTFAFSIDLRAISNPFLALDAVCGNGTSGTYVTAEVLLGRSKEELVSATDRGFASLVEVTA
jgi:hypothetical protein